MRMQLSIQDPDLMVCYIHFIMQETLFIKRNVAIRAAALSLLSFLGLVKSYGFSDNFSLFIQLLHLLKFIPNFSYFQDLSKEARRF